MADVPHSTLVGAHLHHNVGDSRTGRAWTLNAGTTDALLIENSNGNDLLSITTSTTPGSTAIQIGNATDLPTLDVQVDSMRILGPTSGGTFLDCATNAGTDHPLRVVTAAANGPHSVWLSEAWLRIDEVAADPSSSAGTGYLYSKSDAGLSQLYWMDDAGTVYQITPPSSGGTPGGSDPQLQYNNAGAFGGVGNVTFNDDNLQFKDDSAPTAPSSTGAVLFSKSVARSDLAQSVLGEMAARIQPAFFDKGIQYWSPSAGSSAVNLINAKDQVNGGTRSTPALADTNLSTTIRRTVWTSSAVTNAPAGGYVDVGCCLAGSTGRGGYRAVFRFMLLTVNANMRLFVGLREDLTAPTASADPSAYTGALIGVSADAGDTQIRTLHNDSAGASTEGSGLGANFTLTAGAVYDLEIIVPRDGTKNVAWTLSRLDTVDSVTGSFSTEIPASGTLLAPIVYANTGSTGTAVAIGQAFIYIEPGT